MSTSATQGSRGQFQGLPTTLYVNSHLLKAINLADKVLPYRDLSFHSYWLRDTTWSRRDLDTIERGVEFLKVLAWTKDGKRQVIDQSKLYDFEKYGINSSYLKRRSLTKKGTKRYLDAILCYWFYDRRQYLPFRKAISNKGFLVHVLELDNPSSPKNYSILFNAFGEYYEVTLKGSGLTKRRKRRATGRTSNKTVAAETIQQDNSQGSERTSRVERFQRAVQAKASKASVNLSSSGPSYPGE